MKKRYLKFLSVILSLTLMATMFVSCTPKAPDNSENNSNEFISQVAQKEYEYGFTTDVHTETINGVIFEVVDYLCFEKKCKRDIGVYIELIGDVKISDL